MVMSLLMGVLLGASGCRSTEKTEPVATKSPVLVSAKVIGQFTAEQLRTRYTGAYALLRPLIQFGISVYKVEYHTTNSDGQAIQASGALLIPNTPNATPMLSFQHGTITSDQQAPSYYKSGNDSYMIGSLFAASGYIMVLPDYIGYGDSKNVPHPYEHRESLATASLDLLRASREFLVQEKVKWDERLFITGYSEGGFATMALQKKLEEDFPAEFNLVASSCGAGAYDKPAFMRQLINERTSGDASANRLYIWVLQTYNRIYGLNRPMSYYFKAPYAAQIEAQGTEARLNVSINQTFTDTFKKAVNEGTDQAFIEAVQDNDVHNWKPTVPTQLYHGTADNLVSFLNSQNAYDAMQQRGANQVQLIPIRNGNHGTSIAQYALGTFQFFSTVGAGE